MVHKTLAGGDVPGTLGADGAVYQMSGFLPEFFLYCSYSPHLLA
jgi:hypothetical protein